MDGRNAVDILAIVAVIAKILLPRPQLLRNGTSRQTGVAHVVCGGIMTGFSSCRSRHELF